MRDSSVKILRATLVMAAKFLAMLVVLAAIYVLGARLVPEFASTIAESLLSPVAIATVTAVTVAYAWLRRSLFARQNKG